MPNERATSLVEDTDGTEPQIKFPQLILHPSVCANTNRSRLSNVYHVYVMNHLQCHWATMLKRPRRAQYPPHLATFSQGISPE